MQQSSKVLAVTGPTATGKTRLAVHLARCFEGEIVSVDSRQVYRGMDLGTGKDLADYGDLPYHLIDVANPRDEYNLYRFMQDAANAISGILKRGRLPVLCGGSALYLASLLQDYHLETFALPLRLNALTLGVYFPRETVRRRIAQRLDARLDAGMVGEVQKLHDQGVSWERLDSFGLEYRWIARHLQGMIDFEEMRSLLLNNIRQFAKRQDIFFRKMEREGVVIHWLPEGDPAEEEKLCGMFLMGESLPPPVLRISEISYPRKNGTPQLKRVLER